MESISSKVDGTPCTYQRENINIIVYARISYLIYIIKVIMQHAMERSKIPILCQNLAKMNCPLANSESCVYYV